MQSLKEQLQHGGGVSLSFSGNFYNGYFDTAKTKFNTLGIKWRYREADSSTWSAWTSLVLNTGFKYGTGNTYFSGNGTSLQEISLGTGFNYKKNYVFELCYSDKIMFRKMGREQGELGIICQKEIINANYMKYSKMSLKYSKFSCSNN